MKKGIKEAEEQEKVEQEERMTAEKVEVEGHRSRKAEKH